MENFTFLLESRKEEPLYMQLYRHIKTEIRAGRARGGEKLPSKRNLSASLNLSVNTVERAYEQLEAEGYIEAKDRSGFYVCMLEDAALPAISPTVDSQAVTLCKKAQETPQYRFDTANVDTQFFPYATWNRLSKNLLYQHREYLELGDGKGDRSVREALCNLLRQTRGVNCTPEQVLLGAGSEYLLGILTALLGPSRLFAMETPCYTKTYHILCNAGVQPALIPLDGEGISIPHLEASGANVVHITPSHQFPMGIIMPVSRRNRLLRWASEGERYIIEDDYDSEFRYAGRPIPSLQGMDSSGRVIYLTTFSKSISPSFRLSALVLPVALALRYEQMFGAYSSTVSRYEQHTLEEFITGGHFERHLNKLRKHYRLRKEELEQGLRQIRGGRIIGANAGLHVVFQLPGRKEAELVELARQAGVQVTGLSACCPEGGKCPGGSVLLGYASLNEQQIAAAANRLRQVWGRIPSADCRN